MNIFLVEDNDLDVEILQRGLKKVGVTGSLIRARDGKEALEMLNSPESRKKIPEPFVILLDINMPRMNGHEFLANLRETPEIKQERVFVFTTSDNEIDVAQAYKKNANGYIVKPDNSSDLRHILGFLQEYCNICEHPVGTPA